MRAIEASISRLTLREISRGNHTRRISLNLLAAIVAGMVLGVTANRQTTIPIEADAFRAGSVSVQAIQPASQIEQGPQTGAHELQFWSAGGDAVRIAPSHPKGSSWNIGLRFVDLLTGENGPGPLRGRFNSLVIHFDRRRKFDAG